MDLPSYDGRGLVNLIAELEARLGGRAPAARLESGLAELIPPASTYVLVLLDGLGDGQLSHRRLEALPAARVARLEAGFCTTTTTSLATVSTGLPPSQHGLLGHLLWLPEVGRVVNTLKWVDLTGATVNYQTAALLPPPNLWERLSAAGIEAITVQPGAFADTPLTRALYRGCRFEPVASLEEAVAATCRLAETRRRLIFTYFPDVDFAAHVFGQDSTEYRLALSEADRLWFQLSARLPSAAVMVGTADHGVLDFPEEGKVVLRNRDRLIYYGDPRSVLVKGNLESIEAVAGEAGVEVRTDLAGWWGPPPFHSSFSERAPDAVLLAGPRQVLLPPAFDRRLRGYHGGLTAEEVGIPLLVAAGRGRIVVK